MKYKDSLKLTAFSPGSDIVLKKLDGSEITIHVFSAKGTKKNSKETNNINFSIYQLGVIASCDICQFVIISPDVKWASMVGWEWSSNVLKYSELDDDGVLRFNIPSAKLRPPEELIKMLKKKN